MKFLKKIFILIFVGLVAVWGIREIRERWESRFAPINIGASRDKQEEQETKNRPFKFAVMSDIHSDLVNFKKALDKFKGEMGDGGNKGEKGFVIITGDLTTVGTKKELMDVKKVLDESGVKYYAVPGNHDYWAGRKTKQNIFNEVFGKNFQSFKIEGYKFILIDNGEETLGLGDQMKWIEKETEECLKIFCLVFLHEPLNHPSSLYIMGEGYPEVDKERIYLISLLKKNNATNVFAGHLHYYTSYEQEGLKTNIVGAITEERNAQSPKFTEVFLFDNKFEKEEVFIK